MLTIFQKSRLCRGCSPCCFGEGDPCNCDSVSVFNVDITTDPITCVNPVVEGSLTCPTSVNQGDTFTASITGSTTSETATTLTGVFWIKQNGVRVSPIVFETIQSTSGTIVSPALTAPVGEFQVCAYLADDCPGDLRSDEVSCDMTGIQTCQTPSGSLICTYSAIDDEICFYVTGFSDADSTFTNYNYRIAQQGANFPIFTGANFTTIPTEANPVCRAPSFSQDPLEGTYDITVFLNNTCGEPVELTCEVNVDCPAKSFQITDCSALGEDGLQVTMSGNPSEFVDGSWQIERVDTGEIWESQPNNASGIFNQSTFTPGETFGFATYRLTITLNDDCGNAVERSILCPNVFPPPPATKAPDIGLVVEPTVKPWVGRIAESCPAFTGLNAGQISDFNNWMSVPGYESSLSSTTSDGDPQSVPDPVWDATYLYNWGDSQFRFPPSTNAFGAMCADASGCLLLSREAGDVDRTRLILDGPCLDQRVTFPHREPHGVQLCFSWPEGMTVAELDAEPDLNWVNFGELWAQVGSGIGQAPMSGRIGRNQAGDGWDWVFQTGTEVVGNRVEIQEVRIPYTDTVQTGHCVEYEFQTDPDGTTGYYRIWLDGTLVASMDDIQFGYQDESIFQTGVYASWGVDFTSKKTQCISSYCVDRLAETTGDLIVTQQGDQTLLGTPITTIACPDGSEPFYSHNDSGDSQSFSGNSQYLAILRGGEWFAFDRANNTTTKISDRAPAGNLRNVNTIWQSGSNSQYFAFFNNRLEKRTVGSTATLGSTSLPASVTSPDGSTAIPSADIAWEMAIGSGSDTPAIIGFWDNAGASEMVIVPFNPVTMALSNPWWVRNATADGVANGTATVEFPFYHNVQTAMGGIVGAIPDDNSDNDTTHYHWSPLDGGTSVLIEQVSIVDPNSHQAFTQNNGQNVQITSEFGLLTVHSFGSPPSLANKSTLCTVPEADLEPTIPGTPGFVVYQHGHIIGDCGVISTLDSENTENRGLALIDYSNGCSVTPFVQGYQISNQSADPFLARGRPSISPDKSMVMWHESLANGQTVVKCASTS